MQCSLILLTLTGGSIFIWLNEANTKYVHMHTFTHLPELSGKVKFSSVSLVNKRYRCRGNVFFALFPQSAAGSEGKQVIRPSIQLSFPNILL